jgi:hypothetical protein
MYSSVVWSGLWRLDKNWTEGFRLVSRSQIRVSGAEESIVALLQDRNVGDSKSDKTLELVAVEQRIQARKSAARNFSGLRDSGEREKKRR